MSIESAARHPRSMLFAGFCRRLADLKVAKVGGRKMPYKPLLVASVVVLIHKGKLTNPLARRHKYRCRRH